MDRKNLTRLLRLVLAFGALCALALTSGCVAAAVGAGAVYMELAHREMDAPPPSVGAGQVSYVEGSLETSFPAGIESTARAVNATFPQLGYPKVSEKGDALGDTLIARTGHDKIIEIKLETVDGALTKVTIRVGAFGDEALSRSILGKIKVNLGDHQTGPVSSSSVAS